MSYIGNEPGGLGKAERFIFTATGTTPTITHDSNGVPISYTPNQVSVYLNGVKQVVGTDVTCTNGSTLVFAADLVVGDVVEAIALSTFTATAVDSSSIVSGAIDLAHMSVNSIDSDQYVDASIDSAHIGNDQIDSQHYAAGSIDLEHMSSESVDEDNLHISNAGSNGQFLTKQSGNAGGLTWADAAAGGVDGITSSADATAITISASENVTFAKSITIEEEYIYLGTEHGIKGDAFNNYIYITNAAGANYSTTHSNLGIYQLYCSGPSYKGSGTFIIDHPLPSMKDTHHLIHSYTESPRADLIYRDKVTLVNGTATVNIDSVTGMTEGTFVLLCDDVQCFTSNESDWDAVKGSVSGNILTIECENSSSTAEVAWMVIGDRQDDHMKDAETKWTDDEGKPILEPLKGTLVPI